MSRYLEGEDAFKIVLEAMGEAERRAGRAEEARDLMRAEVAGLRQESFRSRQADETTEANRRKTHEAACALWNAARDLLASLGDSTRGIPQAEALAKAVADGDNYFDELPF